VTCSPKLVEKPETCNGICTNSSAVLGFTLFEILLNFFISRNVREGWNIVGNGRKAKYVWKYIFYTSAGVRKFFFIIISAVNIIYFMPFISFRTSGSICISAGTIQELSSPTLIV
jgi:hypothetical protein